MPQVLTKRQLLNQQADQFPTPERLRAPFVREDDEKVAAQTLQILEDCKRLLKQSRGKDGTEVPIGNVSVQVLQELEKILAASHWYFRQHHATSISLYAKAS